MSWASQNLKIQHLKSEVSTLQSQLVVLQSQLIYGFYENQEPFFIQGHANIETPYEIVTAEHLLMIFHRLRQLQFENWQLKRQPIPECGVLKRKAFGICDAARIKF